MPIAFPQLPDFDNPPVIEVVLSLQFEGTSLQIQHIGGLWQHYQPSFPNVETKPPLDPVMEDLRRPTARALRFEFAEMPALPRTWFVAQSGTELIQVQSDRFIHNWRKTGQADVYPRYATIRKQFSAEVGKFVRFVEEHQLGEVKPVQCEITYINHIGLSAYGLTHGDAPRILRTLSEFGASFLNRPESQQFGTRYVVNNPSTDEPFARLYVDMTPAVSADKREPIFILNLTARGAPLGPGIEGALEFYDLARTYIVCGFTAITTDEMHKAWGKH